MQLAENAILKNGKYHIIRSLGQGGYGITYLATTVEEVKGEIGTFTVSVPVAIKEFFVKTYCVRDPLTSDVLVPTSEGKEKIPFLLKDFVKEAKMLAKINHPNIVKVIDIFDDHQTSYYVMQYLEGCSISEKIGKSGPFSEKDAHNYLFQIASAVSYLHDQHMCHYDIKPSNIMLLDDGKAVLIDFGISRHYDENGVATSSRPIGYSSGFSCPEQLMGSIKEFSPASDIYSLSATLYYMLTGKVPHDVNDMSNNEFNERPPGISSRMWEGIVAGMNLNVEKRPQSVNAWLAMFDNDTVTRPKQDQQELKKESREKDSSNKIINKRGIEPPKTKKPYTGLKKHLIVAIIFGVCLLLGLTIIKYFLSGKSDKEIDNTIIQEKNEVEVYEMRWQKKNRYGNSYIYTGTVIDSIPNGYGSAKYSDGSIYKGIFKNGLRQDNHATYIDPNGSTFTGTFNQDSIVKGRITATDGQYYEGIFSDDKPYNGGWYDPKGKLLYHVIKGKLTEAE